MNTKNKEILSFLAYFLTLGAPPRYAVFIDGPWGAGKTHLVREALRGYEAAHPLDKAKVCHISLFGIGSTDDFHLAVVTALYPVAFSKAGRFIGHLARAGLGHLGVSSGAKLENFVEVHQANIYVFDDLERCELSATRILGLINGFVEHDGSKVIIIGNETEFDRTNDYERRREKVIGQTLLVRPAVSDAMSSFFEEMENVAARKFLVERSEKIREVFDEAGNGNLRVLRRTIAEYGRFWDALQPKHLEKTDAMEAAMRLFFALSVELRSGQISIDDIAHRRLPLFYGRRDEANQTHVKIIAARRRHTTDLADEILSSHLLQEMLGESQFDKEKIADYLNQTLQFGGPSQPAAWQTLWHFDEVSTQDAERALAEVDAQIARCEFIKVGEILHVFGLKLALSDFGMLSLSNEDVVIAAKQYIDMIKTTNLLPAARKGRLPFDLTTGSSGLGYFSHEKPEFRDIFAYLVDAQSAVEAATYNQKAAELLKQFAEEPNVFADRICFRDGGENDETILRSPVFASISVEDFVQTFLGLHPQNLRPILTSMVLRHERGGNLHLVEEREWVRRVHDAIISHASAAEPWERTRLERAIQWSLQSLIDRWFPLTDEASDQEN